MTQKIRTLTDLSLLRFQVINRVVGLEEDSEMVEFHLGNGSILRMHHHQDCCEHVALVDFDGGVEDLTGGVILSFEEAEGETDAPEDADSYTWTFYKIQTSVGCITLRWLGESNGYYSESVDLDIVTEE